MKMYKVTAETRALEVPHEFVSSKSYLRGSYSDDDFSIEALLEKEKEDYTRRGLDVTFNVEDITNSFRKQGGRSYRFESGKSYKGNIVNE